MAYVFAHFLNRQPTPSDLALSDTMITFWTNFAKKHDPNAAGLPAWPAFHDAAPQMMYLVGLPKAGPLASPDGLQVLDDYFAWRRR
jgi:para-nitrobenzyl esterase